MRRWCCVAAILLAACSGRGAGRRAVDAPQTSARAYRITRASQLLPGLTAAGRIGDIRMDNGVIAVIVSDPRNVLGFALSGGNVVDAARVDGRDNLRQLFLYLDDRFPRQGVYDRIEIETAKGDEAVVVVHGADSELPTLTIRHEYRLAAGADYLELRTAITNRGDRAVDAYELGDVVQWGLCERFFPEIGWARGRVEVPWFAGVGDDVTYGFTAPSGKLTGPHGTSWSDPILTTVRIAPGETTSYQRYFIVGDDTGVAGVASRIYALRGERVQVVAGSVVDRIGHPIAGAHVELSRDGWPMMRAITNAAGGFAMPIPPGRYTATASAPGRDGTRVEVDARAPVPPIEIRLSDPSTALVSVTPPGPAKLTFLGEGDTVNPTLGPRHKARGAGNVVASATGRTRVPLAPGRYRVVASRGPEWTIAEGAVEIRAGREAELKLALARAVDTTGYLSGDFHQHALPSGDSAMSLEDRVVTNLVEGLDIIVSTDHNTLTDYRETVERLEVADRLATVVGVEATSETVGHYNAYPLTSRPELPRKGAPEMAGLSPSEIFDALRALGLDIVIQVNHPRAEAIGYFELFGFDPTADTQGELDLRFDAIEVLNGKRIAQSDRVILDWFWLIGHGHVVTGMGNSDSHGVIGAEVGYPRSYLGVGFDDPTRLTTEILLDVIKHKRDVLVSNGPFVRVEHDGKSAIGATLTGDPAVEVAVTVDAAPWVDVQTLAIFRDGEPWKRIRIARGYAANWQLPAGSWYVFLVRGTETMNPVSPGAVPYAITNPVWVTP